MCSTWNTKIVRVSGIRIAQCSTWNIQYQIIEPRRFGGHDVPMLIPWNGEALLFSTPISLLHTIYHCHHIAIRIMLRSSLDSPKPNGTRHRGSQPEGRRGEDYDCH